MSNETHIYAKFQKMDEGLTVDRHLLICVDNKCMSGKITKREYSPEGELIVGINFISPSFFQNLHVGQIISLKEASKELGKGTITRICKM